MLLAINAGSSSLKLAAFDAQGAERMFDATVAEIGGAARMKAGGAEQRIDAPDHLAALKAALGELDVEITALVGAGHRVVHGGDRFVAPARIDAEVIAAIDALSPLAPLHNPPALAGIRAMAELAPELPQAACFDTAFHAGQSEVARAYAIPRDLTAAGLRRYGFHGLSYEGLARRLSTREGGAPSRVLALHLGNGASVCAIKNGASIASSMGYSPLEGLTMGTRCGCIDPALVLRLARERGVDETERVLTRDSGLKGLSGGVSDMRELEASGAPEADFAIEHFCYWAARHGGSMIAALGGVDLIAFTGGIGEKSERARGRIEELLAWTGAPSVVIEADEERVIAEATAELLD